LTGEFWWWLLDWRVFENAQRSAVLDFGYETKEWRYIRDLKLLYDPPVYL
jgi:hypothetical protein